ncbi:hypothetical protein BpHYR1_054522 [Brachionus plicatilis]|uniref:Uncharacterized protein n=1 Tax=Brachionus plicatilis TaxID=10195 RepID=A0A3M7S2Z0_BRAPC|nr:hypothetical protein BpHYR1_054522 [Brachionus plicatilis]
MLNAPEIIVFPIKANTVTRIEPFWSLGSMATNKHITLAKNKNAIHVSDSLGHCRQNVDQIRAYTVISKSETKVNDRKGKCFVQTKFGMKNVRKSGDFGSGMVIFSQRGHFGLEISIGHEAFFSIELGHFFQQQMS